MKQKLKGVLVIVVPIALVLLAFSLPFKSKKDDSSLGNSVKDTFVFSPFSKKKATEQDAVSDVVIAEKTSIEKIYPDLPIYIEGHETSVGITTSIDIYRTSMDPWDEIRVEIKGIEYTRPAIDIHDPNMIAFQETILMAKDVLSARGINLSELKINYGNVARIRSIAKFWVEHLDLL
jgi:hypothetical protein